MVTVSHVVKSEIDSRPMLQEALIEGIVNFTSLAERILPRVKGIMGDDVTEASVIMALRRHADELRKKTTSSEPFRFSTEIIIKTSICDMCVVKTPSAMDKIREIYRSFDYDKGETFNVIQGNYEITMVFSQKHLPKVREMLKGEKIINVEKDLISLTLGMDQKFLYTPGVLAQATRRLAWEDVNIYENISTMTELSFIVGQKDAMRAYNVFQELLSLHDEPPEELKGR